jgi:hypothetical protein
MRVLDARTGSHAELRPARSGLLQVCAHAPGEGAGFDAALRVLLVADVLARTAELGGLQVLTVLALAGQRHAQAEALARDADMLGIHPPAARVSSDQAEAPLGGRFDVHVAREADSFEHGQGGLLVSVDIAGGEPGTLAAATAAELLAGPGHDPLAVRLALMSFPLHKPAALTADVLREAHNTLSDWRHRVAEWAESPSSPIPTHIADMFNAAFGDIDTVSALSLLHHLAADADVPAGAKFEAFVYADRILGLDLACEIGQPRAQPADCDP